MLLIRGFKKTDKKKGFSTEAENPLKAKMVRLVGLEPTTYGLEVRCSIQLSYRRKQKRFISNQL